MDRGELVSDDVMIGIVTERLGRPDAERGFVLDGFPRTVAQAAALDRLMDGRDPLIVLDIVVPESELARRLGTRMICEDCGTNADGTEKPRRALRPLRRPADAARGRQQRRGARAVQDLPARDQAAGRVLSRAADVPVDRRGAGGRFGDGRSGGGDRGGRQRAPERRERRRTRGDCLPVGRRARADARGRAAGGRSADGAVGRGRAGREHGRAGRAGGAADPPGGGDAGVQGVSRVSRDDLRVDQRRGDSRDPVRPARAGRGRHHLDRRRRRARRVLRRQRGDAAGRARCRSRRRRCCG